MNRPLADLLSKHHHQLFQLMPPSAPLLQFVRANLRLTYSAFILRSGWTAEPNTRTIYDVVLFACTKRLLAGTLFRSDSPINQSSAKKATQPEMSVWTRLIVPT